MFPEYFASKRSRRNFLHAVNLKVQVALQGAIDGLLRLVAAVPRMEAFIEQVCDIIFNSGAMLYGRYALL
jgi:hypothetical protein